MKNNILNFIIFLLLSFSFTSKIFANDSFNFNVTEIEILNKGNLIKGLKRGTITTEKNISIKADEFEYDKLLNILKASGNVIVNDFESEVEILTETIYYEKNKEIIYTEKESRAYNDKTEIYANKFKFDKNKNILYAEENVKIIDLEKNIQIYSDTATFLKNDNIFLTKNNSKATDQITIIEANNFKYLKNQNILNAKGNVKIDHNIDNYQIEAEDITYLINEEKIFSTGSTEINIENKYKFESEDVIVLKNKGEVSSENKTTIKDDKFTLYKLDRFTFSINTKILKGDNIITTTNFSKPKSDTFYFSNGIFDFNKKEFIAKNTKILLHKNLFDKERFSESSTEEKNQERNKRFDNKNDPRILGVSSRGDDKKTIINKGIFTSCGLNKSCPAWSVSSNKIIHDKENQNIIYDDALLKIYNFPVFYFPKFFHPDPSVERRSGFLKPTFNKSNIVGSSINLPYFYAISEDQDLTFKPTIFDDRIYMFQSEYRKEFENSSFITDFGYTKGFKSKLSNNRNGMSHIFSKLNIDLDLEGFIDSKLDFFLEKVSMDTYLSIFDGILLTDKTFANDIKDHSTLTSGFDLNLNSENFSFKGGVYAYESLQTSRNNDRFEYVLPYYNYSHSLYSDINGSINLNSQGDNTISNTNQLKSSITNNFNYTTNGFETDKGFVNNFGVYFRNTNHLGKNKVGYRSSPRSEILNIYEFNSSLPLLKEDKTNFNYLTPKLSFRINPSDMKDYSENGNIITADNVFSIDRYGFSDSFESGKSLTLGLDFKKENKTNPEKFIDFKLATILRDVPEYKIPRSSSAQGKTSNLIGSFENKFSKNIKFDYNFSLDNNLQNLEYNDFTTEISINNFITEFSFLEVNGEIGDTNYLENSTQINFDENNTLKFKTRRNRKISLTEYYDLVYEYQNDCLTAGVKYRKTYYQDRDLIPKEDLFFTITLFPLTSLDQKIDKKLYRDDNNDVIWK